MKNNHKIFPFSSKSQVMPIRVTLFFIVCIFLELTTGSCQPISSKTSNYPIDRPENLLVYVVDLNQIELAFYYKNQKAENYANPENLKRALASKNKKLVFATNGGMYNRDRSPQGLYIERGEIIAPLDTVGSGYGNFYLQPNGVFYLTKRERAGIIPTERFEYKKDIYFATQSGPMLLIDGKIHPAFQAGSSNLHIRNAVGILPDGKVLFVMSKEKINFYDLATYFKNQGCQNALYLDGFVSRAYLPAQNWEQLDGNFGVMIGAVEKK